MYRMAFLMAIPPGTEAEYDHRHRAVWPDMLAELRAAGSHTYSPFRQGTQVFAYLEVVDGSSIWLPVRLLRAGKRT